MKPTNSITFSSLIQSPSPSYGPDFNLDQIGSDFIFENMKKARVSVAHHPSFKEENTAMATNIGPCTMNTHNGSSHSIPRAFFHFL